MIASLINERPSSIRLATLSAVTFFASFIFINWFLYYNEPVEPHHVTTSQLFWPPTYFMGGVTLVCASLMPSKPFILAPIAIGGILVGVVFGAFMDGIMEHNLLPVEMMIFAGFSSPGILAGTILGSVIYWIRKKRHNKGIDKEKLGGCFLIFIVFAGVWTILTAVFIYNLFSVKEHNAKERINKIDVLTSEPFDGKKYEGEWKDGKKHGQGTLTWASGAKYEGEWKDGKKHGQGTLTWASGKKYEGEWKDDVASGGWLYWANGQKTWSHKNTSGKWIHSTKGEEEKKN